MKKKEEGFTLIELLVVVGILAVLTVTLLSTFNPVDQLNKAYDARRKSDLAQIQRALQIYYQDNNSYPQSVSNEIAPGITPTPVPWGSPWQPYINVLPKDPGGKTYVYYSPDGQTYYLYASLDRGSLDSQACHPGLGTVCANVPSGVTCGCTNDICNYGVSSPNTSP